RQHDLDPAVRRGAGCVYLGGGFPAEAAAVRRRHGIRRPPARGAALNKRAPKRWAPLRVMLGALVAGVVASAVTSAVWGDTASTPEPVSIAGVGAWAPYRELVTWQNALQSSAAPVDFQYVPHGTLLGRDDFLQGDADFVISGTPFTSDELSQLKNGTKDLI